jgi:hypothetical protein
MKSTTKKVLIALGCLGLAGLLMFAALIAAVVVGDKSAKAKADALCGGTAVGSPADAALERTRKSGSASRDPQWIKAEGEGEELLVPFPAFLPLTGYTCSISAHEGVVTATRVYAVD